MGLLSNQEIADILRKGNFLDEKVLAQIEQVAKDANTPLGALIVSREIMTDEHLGQILYEEKQLHITNSPNIDV